MLENEADTEEQETSEDDSTAEHQEQELSVPKHRLDAVSAELRRAREALGQKDEALRQLQGAFRPQNQMEESDDDEAELEQLGFDPKQIKAMKKMLNKQVEKKAKAYEQQTKGMIASLANNVEEKGFISDYGKDKAKYLPQIKELRQTHAQQGSYLSVEMAYKLLVADETIAKQSKPPKKEPAKEAKAPADAPKTQPKTVQTQGKSIEDWENELDEQIRNG